jgi:hypothetical protein
MDQSEIRTPEEIPAAGQQMTLSGVIRRPKFNHGGDPDAAHPRPGI